MSSQILRYLPALLVIAITAAPHHYCRADEKADAAVRQSLDYLASLQKRQGYWEANQGQYKVAMTALVGTAILSEGSTTTSGRYAKEIRLAVDYLLSMSRPNGLIGFREDYHYTYGHGFSMVFLSQVYGEEEDEQRREEIRDVLTLAVQFCADSQTSKGGWGYVSAKEGSDYDEGSTCITQVQGLRACRNAGIPVSKEIIDRAKVYIEECTDSDGGVQYSIRGGGSRPPITAASLAAMFNAGEYDTDLTKRMREYCKRTIWPDKPGGPAEHRAVESALEGVVDLRQRQQEFDLALGQDPASIVEERGDRDVQQPVLRAGDATLQDGSSGAG